MREWKKMVNGEMYTPEDPELRELREFARSECFRFNRKTGEEQIGILKKLFGQVGEEFNVHPPFQCDYGANIRVGHHFFANFNCVILDAAPVEMGDYCQLEPGVLISTVVYGESSFQRTTGQECARPVRLGNNVLVGMGAIIRPGVSIGDNVIVEPGAVVAANVPANTVVGGNPAKIVRSLNK